MRFLGYLGELEAMLPEGLRGGYREGMPTFLYQKSTGGD
jgi:hypothetical protein